MKRRYKSQDSYFRKAHQHARFQQRLSHLAGYFELIIFPFRVLQNGVPSLSNKIHLVVDLEDQGNIAMPWEVLNLAFVDTSKLVEELLIDSHDDCLIAAMVVSIGLMRNMGLLKDILGITACGMQLLTAGTYIRRHSHSGSCMPKLSVSQQQA